MPSVGGALPHEGLYTATFRKAGSLGLKLNTHATSGRTVVVHINAGSQAEDHPQVTAGLLLQSVGETDVVGMDYKTEVLALLKAAPRPITLSFETENSGIERPVARKGSPTEDLTGSAAAAP